MTPFSVSTPAQDETALRSCPFCGGNPILDLHYEDLSVNEETDADLEFVVIRCSSCGYSKQRSSRHDLIDWWNTRSTPSASAGPQAEAACRALSAVVEFVGKQEPDKLPDELLYGMLGIETMCRHALALYAHPQPQQADGRGAVAGCAQERDTMGDHNA